jgi:dephospho-CoA kinase
MDLPLKIGLTGGIASGKSTVSNLFAKLGVPIIDADVIAHQLVEPGKTALELIIQTFGKCLRHDDGSLNRARLRQQIFTDPDKRQRLEAILHPRIREAMRIQVEQQTEPYCILSIPLLIEAQFQDMVDRVLVVDCQPDLQYQRLQSRDELGSAEMRQIIQAQTSRKARLAIAHEVIYNNSNLDDLQTQVLTLHQQYNLRYF